MTENNLEKIHTLYIINWGSVFITHKEFQQTNFLKTQWKNKNPRTRNHRREKQKAQQTSEKMCNLCNLRFKFIRKKVKLLSCVQLFATPWTVAYQAPPSMGFSRQEYRSGLPFPSPGDLPNQGLNLGLLHCRQMIYSLRHQGN